ncbi:PhoH family protein [Ghiorsea bivora]|uniref:PhoH family protein n=1 Tax=Ghiorsea bivora TaxID=1485545 RepID=UPI0009DD030E|nr:PhoH family protein [Ghiorsea bivora]
MKIKEPVLFECSELDAATLALFCGTNNQHIKKIEDTFHVSLRGQMGKWFILGEQAEDAVLALEALKQQVSQGKIEKQGVEDMLREFRSGAVSKESYDEKVNAIVLAAGRRNIQGKTPNQRKYLQTIADKTLSIGVGPAGCGKTYLAVAHAVVALQTHQVEKIILTRPAVEAGENLGFLPGDLQQKVDPYLRPLFDALSDMIGTEKMAALMEQGVIEIAPLAYMRGRTLNDAFVILDEAQNTTKAQMKMFLTRLGFGSKMVVTGDVTQVDLPREQDSGLLQVLTVLAGVKDIGICRMSAEDVVRHRLVESIVHAYDKYD